MSVTERLTSVSTIALPQSRRAAERCTLGPMALALSSTVKAGSTTPTMRTYMGRHICPSRPAVKRTLSSISPLAGISARLGSVVNSPMALSIGFCSTTSHLAGRWEGLMIRMVCSYV